MDLSAEDLRARIDEGEGRRLEFKRGLPRGERIARTLCAFANTRGGLLLVGVDDHGKVVGAPRPAETAAELRAVARTLLDPPLRPELRVVELEGARVVACSIAVSRRRPHAVLRADGARELVVRVGASNRVATGATLRALLAPSTTRGLEPLERRVLEWVARSGRGEATVAAFASANNVGVQRARRAFTRLEREGRLVAHGPESKRFYAQP